MKINYDKQADAVYIEINTGKFCNNKKIDDSIIIDYDKSGKILGIEILNASKNIPKSNLSDVNEINIQSEI